ncbi:hypothetical protein Vretimale_5455 [Volvox reticuliferus]|uniref:Uncharacterized protein n=1 Tax=Volvox reticuliferus TaxID=1737510 RepID=A0A8J4G5A8_9CHLO|nr:hypothetical protein Vretimale_5455 [Volvox reticuliferus]
MGSRKNEGVECRKFEHRPRRAQHKPSRRGKRDMQALLPLHLVTAGVGIAWVVRLAVNSIQKPKRAPEPGEVAGDGSADADLERSATQWLARNGFEHTSGTPSPSFTEHVSSLKSSYAELELLAEGDFVYIRSGGSVLTALVPTVRQLTLQPLQLAKGKPDAVPTAPLEAISVWLVRRCKQEVVFELLGPHDRRHILEADLNTPHGVALADGSRGKRGRWLITSQGLASVKWPSHVLSLQLVNVQLLDARAVKSVRDVLGYKLAEARSKLRQEETARTQAEVERVAEVRAQLDAAVLARHAAEREVAALQSQKAEEAARAKAALARVSKVEFEAQQAEGTVRRQHQQIQGMLAVQAEELRTLQQELQIAREANEGLKRAMHEKMMSLQGALELRDARILELEEENDRMDTVLQVIQAQLGAGNMAFSPEQRSSGGGDLFSEQLGVVAAVVNRVRAGSVGSAGSAGSRAEHYREPAEEPSLSSIVGTLTQPQQSAAAQSPDGQPLWRSLLDLTGDLSVTALKESLAISRRNTVEDAPTLSVASGHHWQSPFVTGEADSAAPPGSSGVGGTLSGAPASAPTSGTARRSSGLGGATDEMRAASGNWGSDGGSGDAGVAAEYTFVSAAVRMSGHLGLASGGSTASPLRQQQPQVPGAAGAGGVGFHGVVQTHPSGTGADAAARRGSHGGRQDGGGPGSTRNRSNGSARVSGAVSARSGAAIAASSCSPAQLEYGLEATLTLDSLRRRMRQLEAERERLELLRVSLEESLPWRTGVGAGDSSCVSYLAALLQEPSGVGVGAAVVAGDGVAFVSTEDGHLHLKQVIQKSADHLKQAEVQGATTRQHQFRVDEIRGEVQSAGGSKEQAVACAMYHEEQHSQGVQQHSEAHQVQYPGVGPGCVHGSGAAGNLVAQQQRRTDSGSSTRSPAPSSRYPCANESDHGSSPGCAMRATPPLASPSYGIRELQQGSNGRPGSKASPWALPTGGAASAGLPRRLGPCPSVDEAACNRLEEEDSLSSSCCSSNGHSGNSATSKNVGAEEAVIPSGEAWLQLDPAGVNMSPASSASAPPDADPVVVTRPCTVTVAVDSGTSPADSRFTEGAITGVVRMPLEGGCYNAVGPAGMLLPGLRIDGNTSQPGGFYDSIDGLCNLGSTRGMPTARGAGWQTARRVVHSRQPSGGVAIDVLPLTVADGAPSPGLALKLPPRACSPAPLDSHRHCGTAPRTADVTPRGAWTGAGIPKSCGSTPCAGEFGVDEDGLVLCDEQVTISPPPAMLLSPLDKLRGAAAAAVAVVATTTGPDGGLSRAGGRLLSALGEDDEEY